MNPIFSEVYFIIGKISGRKWSRDDVNSAVEIYKSQISFSEF